MKTFVSQSNLSSSQHSCGVINWFNFRKTQSRTYICAVKEIIHHSTKYGCLHDFLVTKKQEHGWPHFLILQMAHLSQIPEIHKSDQITRKLVKNKVRRYLNFIHNQEYISLQIIEMFSCLSYALNVFLMYFSFGLEILFAISQRTLTWKN